MSTFGTIITQNINISKIIIAIGFVFLLLSWIIYIGDNVLDYTSILPFIINTAFYVISFTIISTGVYCKYKTKNENYNSSMTQSKANITMALNDEYQDVNDCNISDDMQGSFSSGDIRYNFHVNDNKLYIIEESVYNDTNTIQIIDGKNY